MRFEEMVRTMKSEQGEPGRDAMLTITSRSGFRATASIGSQLRVCRDQRACWEATVSRFSWSENPGAGQTSLDN